MKLFQKLFGSKSIKIWDSDFGEIKSFDKKGEIINWEAKYKVFNTEIELYFKGDLKGIFQNQKEIILSALENETHIIAESEKAIRDQFKNAKMEFVSINKHFDLNSISVSNEGFEIIFRAKKGRGYFFNVLFENNKQIRVSIDG